MTDGWKWATVNRAELARYVTPHRSVAALGGAPSVVGQTTLDLLKNDQHARLIKAIYDDLSERRVEYSLEPVNDTIGIQRIRTPEEILGSDTNPGEGTCLDLALLFAGLCEQRYLLPIVVVFKDHAIALVSTVDDYADDYPVADAMFTDGVCDKVVALKDLVGQESHLAVECTGFAVTRTSGDPRRAGEGQLSFADACAAGRQALADKTLRFAIDPLGLHRVGIQAHDQIPQLDPRLDAFMRGAHKAGTAVDAITTVMPEMDDMPSGDQLTALRAALREVLKTYDVVQEVSKRWLTSALRDDIAAQPDLIADLATGNLATEIEDRRGHCNKIGELYWTGGAREFFSSQLPAGDPHMDRVDDAFGALAGADSAFFDRAAAAGEYMGERAMDVLGRLTANDVDEARAIARSSAPQVAVLQQAVAANRRHLKKLIDELDLASG